MVYAKLFAWLALIAMSAALLNGFVSGDFFEDGSALLENPWGIVSVIDLYAGFTLFAIWIAVRETSWVRALIWIVALMILGFFTGAIYVLYALYGSDGTVEDALVGKRAHN